MCIKHVAQCRRGGCGDALPDPHFRNKGVIPQVAPLAISPLWEFPQLKRSTLTRVTPYSQGSSLQPIPDGCGGIKSQLRMTLKGHPHSRASSRAQLSLPWALTQPTLSLFSVLLPSLPEVFIPRVPLKMLISISEKVSQEIHLLTLGTEWGLTHGGCVLDRQAPALASGPSLKALWLVPRGRGRSLGSTTWSLSASPPQSCWGWDGGDI